MISKDDFVIKPDQERSTWTVVRLALAERLNSSGEGDALEAAGKYNRVVWTGLGFTRFFKSVKSRDRGDGDILNPTK